MIGAGRIPAEQRYARGLEGLVAGETAISHIDGQHGRLIYRGYPIEDLVGRASFEETSYLVKGAERKKMAIEVDRTHFELLSPNLKNKKMEALVIRMEKGGISGEKTHIGEEVGLVIKGKIRVSLQGKDHIMEEGDSIYFPSTLPHRIENMGDSEAVLFWVMTPPSF